MTTRKIITVACIVKSIVYASGEICPPSDANTKSPKSGIRSQGRASCQRTPKASAPPIIIINSVVMRNCFPIIL